jgi:hypothetical protein
MANDEKGSSTMPEWNSDEVARIGAADELQISSVRPDGTLTTAVTIWVVPHGDELYVRSANGSTGGWYRRTQLRHQGHIRAGGVEKDVTFTDITNGGVADDLDIAYRSKYRRYGTQYVDPMLATAARAATLKLTPR